MTKELKYRQQARKFIEDRGFSGIANQVEVEVLMSAFALKMLEMSDIALCAVCGSAEDGVQ